MNRHFSRPRSASSLGELLAHNQITAVLASYCQGIDRKDWELVLSCYHDDAIDDHAQFRGTPVEFVEWVKHNHQAVVRSRHSLSNISIHILDENPRTARVESYFLSEKTVLSGKDDTFFHAGGSDETLRRTVAGRYIDTFEERDLTGWRIAHREVVIEWARAEDNENYLALEPTLDRARRDEHDPLYEWSPRLLRNGHDSLKGGTWN